MNNTFRISKIILSVPALDIHSPFSDGSISMSGGHITAHVYAIKGNEKLLAGRRDFVGMTTIGYYCSLTVIKPEGYQLVVETVDQYGIRYGASRVHLKSEDETKPGNSWHLNKSGNGIFVGYVTASKPCLSDEMREADIDALCNSDVFQSLMEQVKAQSAEHESAALSLQMGIDRVKKTLSEMH